MKWGCKGHWGHWGCWGCRGHWGCRDSKVGKITTEDFRVIQFLEFSFILIFWKNIVLVESWNMVLKFSTFSVGGCGGQSMSIFFKCVDETQMSTTHEATRHNNSKNSWFFYPSEPFSFTRFTMRHPVAWTFQEKKYYVTDLTCYKGYSKSYLHLPVANGKTTARTIWTFFTIWSKFQW